MKPTNTSPELSTERVKKIEHIIRKFLYYERGLEKIYLVTLSKMATIIYPIEQDEKNVHQILDYMATYPNAVVRFHASDMILGEDTNASYLTEPKALSGAT